MVGIGPSKMDGRRMVGLSRGFRDARTDRRIPGDRHPARAFCGPKATRDRTGASDTGRDIQRGPLTLHSKTPGSDLCLCDRSKTAADLLAIRDLGAPAEWDEKLRPALAPSR